MNAIKTGAGDGQIALPSKLLQLKTCLQMCIQFLWARRVLFLLDSGAVLLRLQFNSSQFSVAVRGKADYSLFTATIKIKMFF